MNGTEIQAHPEGGEDHQLDHRQVILDRETFLKEATTLRSVLADMGIDAIDEACQYLTAVAHRRRNPGSIEWAIANGHVINRWSPLPLVSAMSRDGNAFGLSVAEAFEVADRTLHALHPDRTSLCKLRDIVGEDPTLRQTPLADLASRKSKFHPLLSRMRKEGFETIGDLVDRGYEADPARMRHVLVRLIRLLGRWDRRERESQIGQG